METISVRRTPQQHRAEQTVSAILLSAEKILSEQGGEGVSFTTNHIAEMAGVSIGSLYQYFPNKEAILAKLVEKMLEESRSALMEALSSMPRDTKLSDFIDITIDSLAKVFAKQGQTRKVLLEQLPKLGKFKTLQDLKREIQNVIKEHLLRRYDYLNHDNIMDVVFVVVQSSESVLNTCVYQEFTPLETKKIMDELKKMIFNYLNAR